MGGWRKEESFSDYTVFYGESNGKPKYYETTGATILTCHNLDPVFQVSRINLDLDENVPENEHLCHILKQYIMHLMRLQLDKLCTKIISTSYYYFKPTTDKQQLTWNNLTMATLRKMHPNKN